MIIVSNDLKVIKCNNTIASRLLFGKFKSLYDSSNFSMVTMNDSAENVMGKISAISVELKESGIL